MIVVKEAVVKGEVMIAEVVDHVMIAGVVETVIIVVEAAEVAVANAGEEIGETDLHNMQGVSAGKPKERPL